MVHANVDLTCDILQWGMTSAPLPGEMCSGDRGLVLGFPGGALVAVVDGLGHGSEAAVAAKLAIALLAANPSTPVLPLVQRCHAALVGTRGVVLTVASIDAQHGTLSWLAVGNVTASLVHADGRTRTERIVQRGGVVGHQLPLLQATTLAVAPGDTLFLATDGLAPVYEEHLPISGDPQSLADQILAQHWTRRDDGLVLVARMRGWAP